MNVTFKRDPVWLGSLSIPPASPTLLLLGVDGQQVAVTAPLLLAVSPLVRNILIDLLQPAYGPCFLSLPDVTGKVLQVVVDILDTGEIVGEHEDEIEEVRQVFGMLGVKASLVSFHLDSIQVDQVLDRNMKGENAIERTDFGLKEENMLEVFVKAENKEEIELIYSGKVKIEDAEIARKNVTHSELGSFSHRSFLSNMSFNNVNGEKSKPRPFHARSIGSAAASDKDKIITKKFYNPYFTGNEFSSTESEPDKDEPSLDQIMGKNLKIISDPDQLKFSCNLCSLEFKFKYSLKRHIKTIHEQIRIPCHLCPTKFTKKRGLVMHMKSVHEKIKFLCDLCPLKFTLKGSLVRHIKTVHNQITIPCSLCPSKFTSQRRCMDHIQSVHEHIKYSCDLCPLKFARKDRLRKHIKSVHDTIRISCSLCPSKYTSERGLVKHMANMH